VIRRRIGAAAALVGLIAPAGLAQLGNGIHAGAWTFGPFTDLNGVYDTNIKQTPTAQEADAYVDSTLGLRAGYTANQADRLQDARQVPARLLRGLLRSGGLHPAGLQRNAPESRPQHAILATPSPKGTRP
jgi:hypothetical protein